MAVQAVVDEQFGAPLQRRDVFGLIRRRVEPHPALVGEDRGRNHEAGQGENRKQLFHSCVLILGWNQCGLNVMRSGTGLNVPIRLQIGIERKNAKYTMVPICDTIEPAGLGGWMPR